MIYLASPYSHPDEDVRNARFEEVCHVAAKMIERGEFVYSPIAHAHPLAIFGELDTDWETWKRFDTHFIELCDKVVVLKMDGWDKSVGVSTEIEIANRLGKEVEYAKAKDLLH